MADINDLVTPEFLKHQELSGSVFINNKSSYSGVDIKVIMHVYDGGKLNNQRKDELQGQINSLNTQMQTNISDRNILQQKINSGSSFTASQVNTFNSLNNSVVRSKNIMDGFNEELVRLNGLNPGYSTKILAEIQTLSLSTHRDKFPVRSLGSVYAKGYTRGSRTIAGSMIFTVFDRNVLEEFLEAHPSDYDVNSPSTTALIDQISPFDITIQFANELGQISRMAIYGVEFVNEGQTMSIEDLLLENVTQFVARDYDPMRVVSHKNIDENNRLTASSVSVKASSLLNDKEYQDYRGKINAFDRFNIRNNPFS